MKRPIHLLLLPCALLACALASHAGKNESVQELVTRAAAAKPQDQAGLFIEAAQRQLTIADQLFTDGKVDQAQAAVQDVLKFSSSAAEAAKQTHKKLPQTEIAIRKMAQRCRNIRRTLAFDDQPPLEAAASRLENMSTDLLTAMFQKEKP